MSACLFRRFTKCYSSCIHYQKLCENIQSVCIRPNSLYSSLTCYSNISFETILHASNYSSSIRQNARYLSSSNTLWRRGTKFTSEDEKTIKDGIKPTVGSDQAEASVDTTISKPEQKRRDLWNTGPYPRNSNYDMSLAKYSYRPNVDPSTTSIVLFPGQGTQYVGMGKSLLDISSVQEMFAAASALLGFDLLHACLNGPEDYLSRTQVQQPAILVCSLAAVERLRQQEPAALENCIATAGFSVGEIAALTFAGAMSFEDAVRVIKVRSEAMQSASEQVAGGMATVFFTPECRLGLCCNTAKEFCQKRGVQVAECRVASYLGRGCRVVGGSEEALQFLQEHMADFHLKRLKRLNVSGAFHTEHMRPAAEPLAQILRDISLDSPGIPVHSNIDGKPYRNPNQIRRLLPRQLHSPVRWEQTMAVLYEREKGQPFPRTFECGPGQSLKAILKMNNEQAMKSMENVLA